MKPPPFEYHAPESLEETLDLKARLGPEASLLAGGQSLVPMMNMRLARPAALIDLNGVPELAYVRSRDGGIAVGSMTRQRDLEQSDEAARLCPLLRETLQNVAHVVIRTRGTVGGSIAHADPAAELPATLVALGGKVTASGPGGQREISAGDLFDFHFTTTLEPDEILTEVWFPELPATEGYAFIEISRRHGDYALAGVSCVTVGDNVRLAFTGVGPRPMLVADKDPDVAVAATEPLDDVHATADYRRELVRVLARRAIEKAQARATEARQ